MKKSISFFIVSLFLLMAFCEFSQVNPQKAIAIENHKHQVSITITNPPTQNQTILTNFITINGTTSDYGAGVNKVEVLFSKIPFSDTARYKLAIPVTQGNWSRWSFPIVLQGTESYLVRASVTDNAGNQNTSDVTIRFPAYIHNRRIAFVEPTFTYAAYRNGSFYNFYDKYSPMLGKISNESKITTDLNLLKNRPIPHGPFPYYGHPGQLDIPYINYFKILLQHVKNKDPFVTNITDVDVHQGKIFQTDGRNAYDVLFLFHNEYATHSEYNNLRQFVSNGGTIVFTEANTLCVEVSYNKTNDSISLVKGHHWVLDGKGAAPSVSERWLNENKEWIGSNFFGVPSYEKVYFRNNPFNYTHTEEQFVTNPEAKILIDYQAYDIPGSDYHNARVAAYQMNYLTGKIINLGIWGHIVEDNKAFLNYFDNVIVPLALGPLVNITQYLDKVSSNMNNATYISVPATSPSGAVVNYLLPSAMNNINGQFIPDCSPPPSSTFPIGITIVKCTATDKPDNKTAIATFSVQIAPEPCVTYNIYTNTITVMCNANLSKINQVVNDRSVLEKDPHGVWILNAIIKVSPLAKLTINRTDTSWLKIINQRVHENEPNFILISGNAKIDGVKITSWDPFSNDVIRQNVKGSISRPYIMINNSSGSANISNSEFAFLGFALNPSKYGLSYYSGSGGSSIINNTFHDMWDGFYSDSLGFITIKNNKYYDNLKYGIAMYQSSNDKIYNNLVKSSYGSIYIAGSSLDNHFYNNTMINCTFGFYFADNKSKNNLFENNNLNKISYPILIDGINNIGRNNSIKHE